MDSLFGVPGLLELLQFSAGASVIPELLVMSEDLNERPREGGVQLPLISIQSIDFLPDQAVDSQQKRKAPVLMSPLFEL